MYLHLPKLQETQANASQGKTESPVSVFEATDQQQKNATHVYYAQKKQNVQKSIKLRIQKPSIKPTYDT